MSMASPICLWKQDFFTPLSELNALQQEFDHTQQLRPTNIATKKVMLEMMKRNQSLEQRSCSLKEGNNDLQDETLTVHEENKRLLSQIRIKDGLLDKSEESVKMVRVSFEDQEKNIKSQENVIKDQSAMIQELNAKVLSQSEEIRVLIQHLKETREKVNE